MGQMSPQFQHAVSEFVTERMFKTLDLDRLHAEWPDPDDGYPPELADGEPAPGVVIRAVVTPDNGDAPHETLVTTARFRLDERTQSVVSDEIRFPPTRVAGAVQGLNICDGQGQVLWDVRLNHTYQLLPGDTLSAGKVTIAVDVSSF